MIASDANPLAAASVIEVSRWKPDSPVRTATGAIIGAQYAFSEMNDR
jgi:hypothetical protein